MSTITTVSALQRFSGKELQRLEAITQQEIARAPVGSAERRAALATLHTIRIALAIREMRRGPGL